jgi:hypothetical protein
MSETRSIGSMSMGTFETLCNGGGDSVSRYRLWLFIMTRYDRKRVLHTIVVRECAPDPDSCLQFSSGEMIVG